MAPWSQGEALCNFGYQHQILNFCFESVGPHDLSQEAKHSKNLQSWNNCTNSIQAGCMAAAVIPALGVVFTVQSSTKRLYQILCFFFCGVPFCCIHHHFFLKIIFTYIICLLLINFLIGAWMSSFFFILPFSNTWMRSFLIFNKPYVRIQKSFILGFNKFIKNCLNMTLCSKPWMLLTAS